MKRGLRKYVGQTVIVHQNGPSLQGVLLHDYRDCVVLGHGSSLDDKEDLAGELLVPKLPGFWVQKLP